MTFPRACIMAASILMNFVVGCVFVGGCCFVKTCMHLYCKTLSCVRFLCAQTVQKRCWPAIYKHLCKIVQREKNHGNHNHAGMTTAAHKKAAAGVVYEWSQTGHAQRCAAVQHNHAPGAGVGAAGAPSPGAAAALSWECFFSTPFSTALPT